MVFSSIPAAYLDPANWQQQTNLQGANSLTSQHLHPPPPQPLPSSPPLHSHSVGIRPGSMADRARLANIPMPEAALKCPRCESTNTKFCYFNNYSLSQPRHFCKTCRRYWTRGGALRNVPVGGGCRRNKRTKGGNTKSPVIGDRQAVSTTSCSTFANDAVVPPLRFMAPLHLSDFSSPQDTLGLNYGSVLSTHVPQASDFQIGNAFVGGNGSLFSVPGLDQWKLQGHQLPFFGGFDNSSGSCSSGGVFPYEGSVDLQSYGGENNITIRSKLGNPVKMEENQEVNLSKHFSGINHSGNNDQYWSANAWNDINCFSTSSATNPI